MRVIHGDYHGHWIPYDDVISKFTWDNTSCRHCRGVLAIATSYARSFGPELIEVLVRDNHLILKRAISKRRVPIRDDDRDEEYDDFA